MIELDKIYNCDCLDGMQQIDDNSIDCVVCDLPYGATVCAWDSVIPFDRLWEQYRRICKPNAAIVLFGKQPFTSHLVLSNPGWYRYELIWEKSRVGNAMQLGKQPASVHENIIVFYKSHPTFNDQRFKVDDKYIDKRKSIRNSFYKSEHYSGEMVRKADDGIRHMQSILPFNSVWESNMHPTQKPVDLLRYLIRTYTNEGDTVLDNCSGSGTTAVACVKEKRHFICFEKDETYWRRSVDRVMAECQQLTIF